MKQKYDIKRLHADCLAWCESPTWKPWMVEETISLEDGRTGFGLIKKSDPNFYIWIQNASSVYHGNIFEFAHFIGLDIESYRIQDRDQAVRDYLASIEEGAPLWEGSEWVKKTSNALSICAKKGDYIHWLESNSEDINPIAYTFLRLDLKEGKQ